jgi:hypothetical protein
MKNLVIIFFYILSYSAYSQISREAKLGGELFYRINSNTGYGGTIYSEANVYYNPTKGLLIGAYINLFNYPTRFSSYHFSIDSIKILCNSSFPPYGPPQLSSGQEGIYIKEKLLTVQNILSTTPYSYSFFGKPSINSWVLSYSYGLARDTSIKTIQSYIITPYQQGINRYKNYPVYFTKIYPFPNGIIPFYDTSPQFDKEPLIYCNAGDTINYSPAIYDLEYDSISVD